VIDPVVSADLVEPSSADADPIEEDGLADLDGAWVKRGHRDVGGDGGEREVPAAGDSWTAPRSWWPAIRAA
jgi:hypothetical protein